MVTSLPPGFTTKDTKDTKEGKPTSRLLILYNLKRITDEPFPRSFVDFVSFVVSLGEDWGAALPLVGEFVVGYKSRVRPMAHMHQEIDEENVAMDRAVARKLRENPALVAVARDNLRRWLDRRRGQAPNPAFLEWQELIERLTGDELADFLESDSPKANRLRQSSPFGGILSEPERRRLRQACEENRG